MGLDYIYVSKGNDISALINSFSKVKDTDHPIAVHINTLKGKGFAPAEENIDRYSVDDILRENHLTPQQIVNDVL